MYGGQYFSTPRKDARAPAALLIDKDHPTSPAMPASTRSWVPVPGDAAEPRVFVIESDEDPRRSHSETSTALPRGLGDFRDTIKFEPEPA